MPSLASLLENSAADYPDRDAVVLGDTRLTYAQVDGAANQVANLLVSRGIEPGDKVALSCPNLPYFPIVYYGILKAGATVVPLNVLLKGREVAYHLGRLRREGLLLLRGHPRAADRRGGLRRASTQTDGCEHFFLITVDPAAESPIEGTETLGQALAGQPPTFDTVERRRRRHRGHPLHLRHHRPAQGRRAEPPQHALQRPRRRPALRSRRGQARHLPVRAAAVPLLRADRDHERRLRLRRHRGHAAALRGRTRP